MIRFIRVVEAIHTYCRQYDISLPKVRLDFPSINDRERFKANLSRDVSPLIGDVPPAGCEEFVFHDIPFRIVTSERHRGRYYQPRSVDDVMFEAQAAKSRHDVEGMWRALDELVDLWAANRPASNFVFFDNTVGAK